MYPPTPKVSVCKPVVDTPSPPIELDVPPVLNDVPLYSSDVLGADALAPCPSVPVPPNINPAVKVPEPLAECLATLRLPLAVKTFPLYSSPST